MPSANYEESLAGDSMSRLLDVISDLRIEAGRPSIRALAQNAGVSHTTVARFFNAQALPAWEVVEALVKELQGDPGALYPLYVDIRREANSSIGRLPSAPDLAASNDLRPVRVTVNLTPKAVKALERAVEDGEQTRTDAMNKALQIYALLLEAQSENKDFVLRKRDDGSEERIVII